LGTAEAEVLDRLFPAVKFITPATADGATLDGMKVALSISESDDLLAHGQSELHLLSAMIELARHALSRRAVIAYGGDLREKGENGYTRQLFELVRAYQDLGREPLNRILNFLPFHIAADLPETEEARLMALATFVKVPPPAEIVERFGLDADTPQPVPDLTPGNRFVRARCLTAMREVMSRTVDARVVLGGRVSGHQGKYPGILEEAHLMLRAGKPLYLVGGFGGCARVLARAVGEGRRPEQLTRAYQMAHPRVRKIKGVVGETEAETIPFEQLESAYATYARGPATGDPAALSPAAGDGPIDYEALVDAFVRARAAGLNNGLTEFENRELFETSDLDRITSLVMTGLARVHRQNGPLAV
jgi:hypothetical protein